MAALNFKFLNFQLTYEDSENIKADRVNTVVFNLHQIKRQEFFWDIRYFILKNQQINVLKIAFF